MSTLTLSRVACVAIVLGAYASPARAQYWCDPCRARTAMQPVLQSCYQTVPVTEYQRVKRTVQRPVYRTEYIEEPVTVYKPVTEVHKRQVPTVHYQTVTTNRVVHRDMGRWATQYRPITRRTPCQYDNRPGVIGWINRTGYQLSSAFRPRYSAIRRYQPQVVAYNVPQTRQVAVHGTREVAYNVTRMVPTRTVQKRAVQRLTYVDQEVTEMRPRTTYRTVPIGTSVAYAPVVGGNAIAFGGYGVGRSAEIIDDRAVRSALSPEPDDSFRSAEEDGESERFTRPRSAARDTGTATGGTRFESRADTPAKRSGFSSESDVGPGRYENSDRNAEDDIDPFEFDTPAASTTTTSRFVKTGLKTSVPREYEGWRASRTLTRTLTRQSPVETSISIAGR